jgi:transcriptional regulator with XRE-family HTH domain
VIYLVKNKLLEIRLSRGYKKQKEFAEYINIKSNRYSKMENNVQQPTLEQVILISRKLNIPIEEIVYWED